MRILAVGGGSGGHVTPVVAVLREIRKKSSSAEVRFWCDKKFAHQARSIIGDFDKNIPVHVIISGKFRRYNNMSLASHLLSLSLVLSNIRDAFLVVLGFFQSFIKLLIWRPDVVFAKGGYVCLPVGIAVRLLAIPLVIHDSDAHPGLTNRVLSRWAKKIATGAPLEYYSYPSKKARYTGIPIAPEFHIFSDKERQDAKEKWGVKKDRPLIVITGGGLGAKRINDAVVVSLKDILSLGSVVLVSGAGQYDELRSITPPNDDNFQLHAFVSNEMATLLGAADVVVARAGATTILELAALARPTILIPNGQLTGGHQLKNTEVYLDKKAVVAIDESKMVDDPQVIVKAIEGVLLNTQQSNKMAEAFHEFSKPDAASDVADMIISCVK